MAQRGESGDVCQSAAVGAGADAAGGRVYFVSTGSTSDGVTDLENGEC